MNSHRDAVLKSPDANKVYDVIGIGFGPSNISLAIALNEMAPHLEVAFVDSEPCFGWHGGMLFKNATMQVSFLKDLVSFRNPRSHFTFINYLHSKGRIAAFSNKKDFFPSRIEFHDYLAWCAAEFNHQVFYGNRVTHITEGGKTENGEPLFEVELQVGTVKKRILTKALVHSAGLQPQMPEGVTPSERITHVHKLMARFKDAPPENHSHCVVVGGGQSAAEAVEHLLEQHPSITVTAIVARFGYTPADDSPFVNEIFDAEVVDDFYSASPQVRKNILALHASTNYTAVDLGLIENIYRGWYEDRVSGKQRLTIERMSRFQSVQAHGDRLQVTFSRQLAGDVQHIQCDHLICATGFAPRGIEPLLCNKLQARMQQEDGVPLFSRHYQVKFTGEQAPLLYSIGMSENSHGLTATLISNMAVRAGEIAGDLQACLSRGHYDKAI